MGNRKSPKTKRELFFRNLVYYTKIKSFISDRFSNQQEKKKTQGRQGRPKMNFFSIIRQKNM